MLISDKPFKLVRVSTMGGLTDALLNLVMCWFIIVKFTLFELLSDGFLVEISRRWRVVGLSLVVACDVLDW